MIYIRFWIKPNVKQQKYIQKMEFSEKTKEAINAIVQETLAPIIEKKQKEKDEEQMSEAVKQWINDKQQNKFKGKEI